MDLSNDLRLGISGNLKISKNIQTSWNYCLVLIPPPKMKIVAVLAKIS